MPINDQVNDIYFTDTLIGWAVTLEDNSPVDTAYILHTTDGGNNWVIQLRNAGNLNAVQFIDNNTGYVFGNESLPRFYKTTNGGNNWQNLGSGVPIYFSSDMQFINRDTGWVCSDTFGGGLAKTTNGGNTWQLQLGYSYSPEKVFFINADTGWVLGGGFNLYRSTNGGNNWSVQYPSIYALSNIYFINKNTGFLCGYFGWGTHSIKKTTDGGFNWDSTYNSIGGTDIFFINNSTGYISGNLTTMQKTTDGGNNWYDQIVPYANYKCLYFLDTLIGYSGGTKMIKTIDGGGPVSNIKQISSEIPQRFKLFQNYPNPFNMVTIINYELSKFSDVSLKVNDISGKVVTVLIDQTQNAGTYQYIFDAADLTSGIYFYRIAIHSDRPDAGGYMETKKMLFVK